MESPHLNPLPQAGEEAIEKSESGYAESELRQRVIDEAEGWLRTPYHHAAAVKGVGVDCAQILIEVYAAVGLAERFVTDYYPSDWMLHRSEERYLANVQRHCVEVDKPQMGDIALFRYGRCYSHAGIVVQWPRIIHAQREEGCCYADAARGDLLGREVKFFSFFPLSPRPLAGEG